MGEVWSKERGPVHLGHDEKHKPPGRDILRTSTSTRSNSSFQANFGKFRPRCRFDRIYLRDSLPTTAAASHFGLIGLQKITDTQAFPSDHWGLRCVLNLVQESTAGENMNHVKKRKAEQAFD